MLGAIALMAIGLGTGTPGTARAVGVAGTASLARAAAPAADTPTTAPCDFASSDTCASIDPSVKIYVDNQGDVSSCDFTWTINWGDDSDPETVVLNGPPSGSMLLAKHKYATKTEKKYTITAEGEVTSGSCTATGGTLTFTLLAYVALGDSYSAGDGDGNYLSGTGFDGNDCLRSTYAYPERLAKSLGYTDLDKQDSDSPAFSFHACTGAEIPDFDGSQVTPRNDSVPAQLTYLRGQPGTVGLVTFSIGGNDAGFGSVMKYCALRKAKEPSCKAHSDEAVSKELATIESRLITLYNEVQAAPRVVSNATIIVLGYPRFFPAVPPKTCETGFGRRVFDRADMEWINSVIASADAKIDAAAKAAGITFVPAYDAFGGHELCQPDSYLFRVSLAQPVTSFHPTAAGQGAFANLVEAAVSKSATSAQSASR